MKYIAFADGVTMTSPPAAPSVGGGGGGSAAWNAAGGNAPIMDDTELGEKVFLFTDGGDEKLYLIVDVPTTYDPGNQVTMRCGWYSPSTTGTVKLKSTSYLIATDATAADSTTNSRASTNTATTNSATAKAMRVATLDLTDATGLINGVAVAAGDSIRVILERDSANDTDTADVRFVPSKTGVAFA